MTHMPATLSDWGAFVRNAVALGANKSSDGFGFVDACWVMRNGIGRFVRFDPAEKRVYTVITSTKETSQPPTWHDGTFDDWLEWLFGR